MSSEPILGYNGTESEIIRRANYLYGYTDQISMQVILFKNKPEESGFYQEQLLKGGNKNEFIVCVGTDNADSILWSHVISWTTNEKLKLEVRDSVVNMGKLDMTHLTTYIATYVPKRFIRREFKEFDYITVDIPIWILVVSFTINLIGVAGISFFIHKNHIDNNRNRTIFYRYRR